MDREFWLRRWQENRTGFHQARINAHLQRFWPRLEVPAGETVFVPLCGKSRDMLWLAAQGYRVVGVELSPLAVHAFFKENGLKPEIASDSVFERYRCAGIEILCGDFFALEPDDLSGVKGVYDRASLIALPPAMRGRYAQQLTTLLPERPPVLLITLDYPPGAREGPPFAVNAQEVEALFGDAWSIRQLASREPASPEDRLWEQVFVLAASAPPMGADG